MTAWRTYTSLAIAITCGGLVACRKQTQSDSIREEPSRATIAASTPNTKPPEFDFVTRTMGGRDDEMLPWIVAFHGLGDTPEAFAHLFDNLAVRAHVYLPRAPITYGSGFDWFGARVADQVRLTEGIQSRLPSVAAFIDALSRNSNNAGNAIVTGFSQGGILSFAVAAADLQHVKVAVPIAGWLPPALAATPTMRVVAFHGEADSVVPFGRTQTLVNGWQAHPGSPTIEFHTYRAVEHTISAAMYKDWTIAMQQALATADR